MTITDLLILQIIAHLLSDFTFQSEKWARFKNEKGFKSEYLKWHVIIVFIVSWLLSFQLKFIFASIIIALFHWIIDGLKHLIFHNEKIKKFAFFIDQAIHLILITGLILLFNHFFELKPYIQLPISKHWLLIIAGFILITKPANIIIREVFKTYGIYLGNEEDILSAGMLIGVSERIITLTLILSGQFEAVGFIIAAKSILRFKDTDTTKTEYVLIGTLLSFGTAILTGIGIQMIK
jgi:Protein of unknown function (DUF3307)